MTTKRLKYWLIGASLLVMALLLAGCGEAAVLTGASWPGVTATEETIYLAYGPQVAAIDSRTGDTIWIYPTERNRQQLFYAAPAVNEDIVVVADYTDKLIALNRTTGRELWSFQSDRSRFIGGAVIGNSIVYAGTVSGRLYALDLRTADPIWTFSAERDIWSTPLLVDGTLYVTSLDRHVYALNAETGQLLWQYPQEGQSRAADVGAIIGTPALYNGVLYFGSFNNKVYALDITDQQVLWTYETTNWVWSAPTLDEETGLLIGGDLDGHVFALDPATGSAVWTFETDGPVVGTPVISEKADGERVLFIASGDGNIYTLDVASGTKTAAAVTVRAQFTSRFLFFETGTDTRPIPLYAPPVLLGRELLLIGAHQGNYPLYALDHDTLVERWHYDPSAGS